MRKLKRKKKSGGRIYSLIMIVLLPLLVTVVVQNRKLDVLLGDMGEKADQKTDCVPKEILIGMLAKEIDTEAPEEVLRAQCVIARTNYLDAEEKGAEPPDKMTVSDMQEIFGNDFETVYERLEKCAKDTAGEVLMWQGDYIYAAYHAISSGNTRKMEELYENVSMPYLTCCDSHDDAAAEGYLAVYYWKKEEFLQKIKIAFPNAAVEDVSQVQVLTRDSAGYVLTVLIGGTECEGESFRKAMELPSACLTIAETGDKIRIVTEGVGHGFGMSQNMAGVLAKEGKNYREILEYFFPETELIQK